MSDWTPEQRGATEQALWNASYGWDIKDREGLVEKLTDAVLVAVGPMIAASALRDAAEGMRSAKDYGHWNLRSEDDPEAAYSPDVWVDRRAARIEKEAGR
jgi:hypothetical protein